jgi:hypothetical protein
MENVEGETKNAMREKKDPEGRRPEINILLEHEFGEHKKLETP